VRKKVRAQEEGTVPFPASNSTPKALSVKQESSMVVPIIVPKEKRTWEKAM